MDSATQTFTHWLESQDLSEDGTGCAATVRKAAIDLDAQLAVLSDDDMWCATDRWERLNALCKKYIGFGCPSL